MEPTTNNLTSNSPKFATILLRAGLVFAGIIILNEILNVKNDTVNYKLRHRGRIVYHGICYENMLDARMVEHDCSDKRFDEIIYDDAKPRETAARLERKSIRRDRPKYNNHHKF